MPISRVLIKQKNGFIARLTKKYPLTCLMRHRVYEPDPVFIGRNISLKHNVSRERIQQIEVRAFEKLQKNIKRAPAKEGLLPLA